MIKTCRGQAFNEKRKQDFYVYMLSRVTNKGEEIVSGTQAKDAGHQMSGETQQ